MLYYNSNKIIKAYKGTSIINKMDDYFGGGSTPTPIPDSYVIPFEDSNVKTLCVNNWGGNVVSGELTYGEAKAVTSLGSVFRGNRNIIKFNELVYFTGLSTLDNGEFAGCTNLTDIVIPSNVTYIGDVPSTPSRAPFSGCSNLSGLTILSGEETLEVHMFCFNGSYWMNSAHQDTPIIFPNRSITFNDGGFAYCDYLTTAYFQSITPPIGLADADISNYRKLSTVYCPIGSYDAYYAVLNPKGKTVIEYDYDADPNNVLAREREWSGKTQSGTTSETKAVFQYITDGSEPTPPEPTDYSTKYLTFEAIEDGTFTFTGNSMQYSVDDGNTWTTLASNTASPTVTAGNKILWKQTNPTITSADGIGWFISSGRFNVEGNIMSLYYGDNFMNQTVLNNDNVFLGLFYGCTNLISAENLVLPATTLAANCYRSMFNGCTNLTVAPELLATTLADYCYNYMFFDCTNLTTAPELLATTLANSCYQSMFYGCTSLTTAPELPATTLKNGCYASMFNGCTSLTTAPELLATTLANSCYQSMFYGCTSLTTAPELPATTLKNGCYASMFFDCTNLTTAPELPATTLAANCYSSMFSGCRSLNSITCLATDISANNCTRLWTSNVAANGTFTKAASMTSWPSGISGIPNGWTVVAA